MLPDPPTNTTTTMAGEEPWDEMMGPPSTRPTLSSLDPPEEPFIRSSSIRSSSHQDNDILNHGVYESNNNYDRDEIPNRWSQYDNASRYEKDAATAEAVYLASNSLAEREYVRTEDDHRSIGSSDDDEYSRAINYGGGGGGATYSSNRDSFATRAPSSNNSVGSMGSSKLDHENIRQEALRMLEVADADENYSVYKTVSGGYTATPKPKTKIRAALSGIGWSGRSKSNSGRFRDDPYADVDQATTDDMEYGANTANDDDSFIDVVGMERRSLANNEKEVKTNSWSSRYTIDNTLLAMTGGTVSKSSVSNMRVYNDPYSTPNARILDRMDRENRGSSIGNNNFIKGAIFGSAEAYSYRQTKVFGKQNVTLPPQSSRQPNLQAIYFEPNTSSMPLANMRKKTWQEKLHQKRFQTRVLLIVGGVLIIFIVTFSSIMVKRKNAAAASSASSTQSVTFYVTSDVPMKANDESKLHADLQSISDQTKFVVHVGNIQNANATKCPVERYDQVADMFSQSSPYPMYIVPGKQDYNECPDPKTSWNNWYNAFSLFNEKFNNAKDITTYYQKDHLENWAFIESNVLFVGVDVIDGTVHDSEQYKIRNDNSFNWIYGMMKARQNDFRSIVIFGNSRPGTSQNLNFFAPLSDLLSDSYFKNVPALYVFANSESINNDNNLYQPLKNVPNLKAVASTMGGTNPPLRINVGFGVDPFILG